MPRTDVAQTNRRQDLTMPTPPPSSWRAVVALLVALGSACYLIAGEPLEPPEQSARRMALGALAKPA
jgi:hypothetical protein